MTAISPVNLNLRHIEASAAAPVKAASLESHDKCEMANQWKNIGGKNNCSSHFIVQCRHMTIEKQIHRKTANQKPPFFSHHYSLLFFIILSIIASLSMSNLCCAYNERDRKLLRQQIRKELKKRKTKSSRGGWEKKGECGEERKRGRGGVERVYLPISRMLFEPEGMWDVWRRRHQRMQCNCREWELAWKAQ